MRFSSNRGFAIGPYQSRTLIGHGSVVQDPIFLPTMVPTYAHTFQMVGADLFSRSATVQLDIQFISDIEREQYNIQAAIVVLPAIVENEVYKTDVRGEPPVIGTCVFEFPSDLKTFEDEPVAYRNVWSLAKQIHFTPSTHLQKGDRLALLLSHSNMQIATLCVIGSLDRDENQALR